ncbi:MAG: chromate transporter [Treponema sp.]|nr:chromate transporter [Treponema sp.]
MSLFGLFCTFFYIGLFTIGGGLVAITLMQQTLVDTGIISSDVFYNMIAISESTPGPLGVNMATYVGYNLYGIPGALITTFGEVLPSIICILIIARFMKSFSKSLGVRTVMSMLRPASTGIILVAAVKVFMAAVMVFPVSWETFDFFKIFNWTNLCAYVVFTFLLFKFKLHPIWLVVIGAVFGIITG